MVTRIFKIIVMVFAVLFIRNANCFPEQAPSGYPRLGAISVTISPSLAGDEIRGGAAHLAFEFYQNTWFSSVLSTTVEYLQDIGIYRNSSITYDLWNIYLYLEYRFYPINFEYFRLFLSLAQAIIHSTYLFDASTATGLSVIAPLRIGCRWIVFGKSGVFIQPSIEYDLTLRDFNPLPSTNSFNYNITTTRLEIGWAF